MFLSFNSTRYIRNDEAMLLTDKDKTLSTPHGTLGTPKAPFVEGAIPEVLSTPHGTLGTGASILRLCTKSYFQLHTVH